MDDMHVRPATDEDAPALVRLINAAYAVEKFFVDADRVDLSLVRAHLGTGEFLVTEIEGELAACVYLERRRDRAYLGLLSVDPRWQRMGLGARLVGAAEERMRAFGCRTMDLRIVNLREELPPFYRRLGYSETGSAPFTAGVETRLSCHFIEMSKCLVELP
jgi:N-acetylglutamate synthase-like GNAT family acetyltransferase